MINARRNDNSIARGNSKVGNPIPLLSKEFSQVI